MTATAPTCFPAAVQASAEKVHNKAVASAASSPTCGPDMDWIPGLWLLPHDRTTRGPGVQQAGKRIAVSRGGVGRRSGDRCGADGPSPPAHAEPTETFSAATRSMPASDWQNTQFRPADFAA